MEFYRLAAHLSAARVDGNIMDRLRQNGIMASAGLYMAWQNT